MRRHVFALLLSGDAAAQRRIDVFSKGRLLRAAVPALALLLHVGTGKWGESLEILLFGDIAVLKIKNV